MTPTNVIVIIKSGRTSGSFESIESPNIDGPQSEYFIGLHSGNVNPSGDRIISSDISGFIVGSRYMIPWHLI